MNRSDSGWCLRRFFSFTAALFWAGVLFLSKPRTHARRYDAVVLVELMHTIR